MKVMYFRHTGSNTSKDLKLYLFELLDEPCGFNATLHVEADVHFDLSERVSQFDDGNLGTHINTHYTGADSEQGQCDRKTITTIKCSAMCLLTMCSM